MFLSSRFCSSRGRARLFSCSFRFSFLNWAEHGGRSGQLQVASAVTVRATDERVNYTLIVQSRKSWSCTGHGKRPGPGDGDGAQSTLDQRMRESFFDCGSLEGWSKDAICTEDAQDWNKCPFPEGVFYGGWSEAKDFVAANAGCVSTTLW